jgi:hypothetical protein
LTQYGDEDERTLFAMKYMAGYLQHDDQHTESLRLYERICQVRQKKLAQSKEDFVTDQINHGIAMTKAYKYRRDLPDSPRMPIPSTRLLRDAVRCNLFSFIFGNFNDFLQEDSFTKLLSGELNTKQRIRCLSEQARVFVLLNRFQVPTSTF